MPPTELVPPFSKKRVGVRRDHPKDKIEKVSRTVRTGERNRLAPFGKRRHHTKMKRYDAHCKTILLMKGSKMKLHRQTVMTPGQAHMKGGRRREQGALLVARCASPTYLDEAQKIDE